MSAVACVFSLTASYGGYGCCVACKLNRLLDVMALLERVGYKPRRKESVQPVENLFLERDFVLILM